MSAMLAKYGVAFTVEIPIVKRAAVDFAVSGDWTPAAGDVKISKDGGAAANVTNLPTAITMGNTAIWQFVLTATEMQAGRIIITVADSATKAVEDQALMIHTYGNASALHPFDLGTATVVAASVTGNVGGSVASVTGNVAGSVASVVGAVGSVTGNVGGNVTGSVGSVAAGGIATSSFAAGAIDASAIATDAIGSAELAASAVTEIQTGLATTANEAAISAQIGALHDFNPAATAVTVGTNNDKTGYTLSNAGVDGILDRAIAEPAGAPTWPASLRTALQHLLALARNKVTQTSSTATLRNDADNASIATAAVADDNTTFTRSKWQ